MRKIEIYNDGSIGEIIEQRDTLWVVRGDEELAEYGYKSRTAASNWPLYPCTPSVFRFAPKPEWPIGDYRVDVSEFDRDIRRLNWNDEKKIRYLYAANTALYNKTGYPKQQYLIMSGNLLLGRAENGWLRFRTLKPGDSAAGLSREQTPWLVHKFDLVCWNRLAKRTTHKPDTPQGIIHYLLISNDGYGYIPLRYVRAK